MELILFDADGTMVDSIALIHECMRRSFVAHGYDEPDESQSRAIVGLTLDKAVGTMLGREVDDEIQSMAQYYKSIYLDVAKLPQYQTPLFPGVKELIHQLAAVDEIFVGMVTGKARRGVERLLDEHDFRPFFHVSRSADDCPSKPHPAMVLECCNEMGIEPKNAIVIGDTSFDMAMAKSAGAGAIGVKWGYHDEQELKKAGADELVSSVEELSNLIFKK